LEFSIKRRTGKENGSSSSGSYQVRIDKDTRDKLKRYVKKNKITAAALLYSGWGILLQKYNNNDDVIFGTTVSGRRAPIKGIGDMVGLFINTLPLRTRVENHSNEKILDFLCRVNQALQVREDYESSSPVNIKEYSDIGSHEELFDTVMVIENYPLDLRLKQKNAPLSFDSYSMFERTHYDLTVGITLYDDDMVVKVYFQEELFEKNAIERMSHHYISVIKNIMENPGQGITNIEMISPGEKREILVNFNTTGTDYPHNKMIHQLFEEQAERASDKIAVIGMEHGAWSMGRKPGNGIMSITYRELNEKSNQLARVLQAEGVGNKDIIGIMIHRSIEMVYGVLAILKSGSAYLPVDPDYPQERIHYMLMDSSANLLLTGNVHTGNLEEGPTVIDIKNEAIYSGDRSNLPTIGNSDDPAYVIYTSGTTGRPKGVLVEHINVVRLVKNTNYITFYPHDRLLQTGALEFDASTLEIWGTLLNGAGLVLVSKETILNHGRLKNVIRKSNITIMWLTSSLFNQVSDIELFEGLTHLLVGGDVLSPPHINRVRKRFPHLNVINGYGPTENTTFSTTYLIEDHDPDREPHKTFPIGKPIANSTAYIVDKNNHLMPVGVPGELIVGGDGVSRGYLNDPGLTAEKLDRDFQDDQDDQDEKGTGKYSLTSLPLYPSTSLYRTGDLARWLPGGNIEFLGRLDYQVKVRGFRVELEEIRNVLLKHKDVEDAVVISRSDKTGENYLCAYVVTSLGISQISRLNDYLSERLPRYMIPSYFAALDQLPLTPNGKLDRDALPEVETIPGTGYCAPRNEREEKLIKIWSDVLDIEAERIGIDDDFFQSGGHSLNAIRLISQVHRAFNTEITLTRLFQSPTIRKLSLYMEQTSENKHSPIELAEKKEYYMLSPGQKRLYVLQTLVPDNVAYNIPYIIVLEGEVKKESIEAIFLKLIDRHESLRTSFQPVEEEVVQKIHDGADVEIEYDEKKITGPGAAYYRETTHRDKDGKNISHGLDPGRCEDIIKMFVKPFDLSRAPLLRAGLIREMESRYLLVFDIHHIIADGVSETILINDLTALYNEEGLPPLKLQYKDYSEWQQRQSKKDAYKQQEGFWLKAFEGKIPVLNMPTDFSRPETQCFEGNVKGFELSRCESGMLKQVARSEGATLFMVLLAVYNVFLSKICRQEDMVVGIPTAGRKHADLDNIIGIFVNTLALRNQPRGEETFRAFLRSVKKRTLEAFENQDYQFEDLAANILVDREAGRNPVFDVMFTSNNQGKSVEKRLENEINKLHLETMEYKTSRFDLILHSFEREKTIGLMFEYSTRLYKKETIERFTAYLKKVASSVGNNPGIKISEIEIIGEEEKGKLIKKIKGKKSKILMELAQRNKAQEQAAHVSADFDY
jgi:amino acid adenylation domain-containing protein